MAIGGTKRETVEFFDQPKYVGLTEVKVISVNPSPEEYEKITGVKPKEDSKLFEYLGESNDGNPYVRIDFWLEELKKRQRDGEEVNEKFKVTFFLEDKERINKDETRNQYINTIGVCSWGTSEDDLPDWFKEREYREAKVGEEDLYNFVKMWLNKLDYKSKETVLELDWKRLIRGNLKELRDQIEGEWSGSFVILATIDTSEKDGSPVAYQKIYNRAFLHTYNLKYFRTVNYSNPDEIARLVAKKPRDLKPYERFILNVTNEEYGCKDYYILKDIKLYDPEENIVASDKVMEEGTPDY